MLIRFTLRSSNPVTLLGIVHPLSDTEPKFGKITKSRKSDLHHPTPSVVVHEWCYYTWPISEHWLGVEIHKSKLSRSLDGVVGVTGYQIYHKWVSINVYEVSKPIGVDWDHVFMKKSPPVALFPYVHVLDSCAGGWESPFRETKLRVMRALL